jgi:hypothetical protein
LNNLKGDEEPAVVGADQYGNFFPINIWQINITKIIEVWLNIGPFDLIGWAR